ncbi:DUF3592 domain-containing protein [Actinoplanes sp. NPDC051851]|uniref:DUF3592 domain-containing protein n=1 Tax=Actinoplanes sp. NPDC051851 TaxID=3154753 RepID=UPI003438F180
MIYIRPMVEDTGWLPLFVRFFLVGMPALVGAGIIVASLRRWFRIRTLATSGQRTTATVVDNQMESSSEGRMRFLPVVTFHTAMGQEIKTALPDMMEFRSHVTGTTVEVIYDADSPSQAVAANRPTRGISVAIVFGLIFLAFAAFAYKLTGAMFDTTSEFGDPWG